MMMVVTSLALSGCDYFVTSSTQEPSELQANIIESRDVIRESSVRIQVTAYRDGLVQGVAFESQGSGVIYAADEEYYYILTNFHVVHAEDRENVDYEVYLFGDIDPTLAELITKDAKYDLAVLRIDRANLTLTLIDMFTRLDDPLTRNEFVLAVGSPSAINTVVTYGEYLSMVNIDEVDFSVIYHSALIYKGNSGGALTDQYGSLVGINTWGSGDDNVGSLAVPLLEIHEFLEAHGLGIIEDTQEPS